MRGRNLERRHFVADTGELEKMDAPEIHAWRLNAKEVLTHQNGETLYIPDRRWKTKTIWGRSGSDNIHFDTGQDGRLIAE